VQNEPNLQEAGRSMRETVQNEPNLAPVGRGRRKVNAQNEPNLARPRVGAGGQMCKMEPIGFRRGRVAEGIVQNEPNVPALEVCP
jgi:hypothetical protein